MTKSAWRRVDGTLVLDKPAGVGSNAVLQHVRSLYRAERAGHTGTLDPMAGGVLVICFGEATKFAGELLDASKSYRAGVRLGVRTSTGDAEGEVLEERPVNVEEAQLEAALRGLRGRILQVPPMYSALKRDGRPLYRYARRGETVHREARPVTIHRLELVARDGARIDIDVSCSKGTYVRALAEDLGAALGCGAHLCGLVRTALGRFSLERAVTVDAIAALPEEGRDSLLLPSDALLLEYPEVSLDGAQESRFSNGQKVACGIPAAGLVRVYGARRTFLGTGWSDAAGALQPRRVLVQPRPAGS
jgi:tRNA pseudouridine55 synthase